MIAKTAVGCNHAVDFRLWPSYIMAQNKELWVWNFGSSRSVENIARRCFFVELKSD